MVLAQEIVGNALSEQLHKARPVKVIAATMSLRQQVEKMVAADDDWEMPATPAMVAKKTQKAIQGWSLLIMRLMWYVAVKTKETVIEKWMMEVSRSSAPASMPPPGQAVRTGKKVDHKATKAGLNHTMIGEPLTPSVARSFPMAREVCGHQPDYLVAKGNAKAYWWTCTQCGSRWERLTDQEMAKKISTLVDEEPDPKGKMDKNAKTITPKGRLAGTGYPSEIPAMHMPHQMPARVITAVEEETPQLAHTKMRRGRSTDVVMTPDPR